MKKYSIGDKITIATHAAQQNCTREDMNIEATIVAEFNNYFLLDTGKFKVCAMKNDIANGYSIAV